MSLEEEAEDLNEAKNDEPSMISIYRLETILLVSSRHFEGNISDFNEFRTEIRM